MLEKLQTLMHKHRQKFEFGLTLDGNNLRNLLRSHGRAFMTEAASYLEGMLEAFRQTSFRVRHQQSCPVSAPAEVRAEYKMMLAIAGWTCTLWSSMNSKVLGWLDDCSIVFLIWLFSTLAHRPDLILGECSRNFDTGILREILSKYG